MEKDGYFFEDGKVWIDKFLEYKGVPYPKDNEGRLYKMYYSLTSSAGYVVENYYHDGVQVHGVPISEHKAFSLIRPPVRKASPRGTIILGNTMINGVRGISEDESWCFDMNRLNPPKLDPMHYVIFKDSRNAYDTNIPWEKDSPNEPIFVRDFVEYDDMPFVLAESDEGFPDVWRMRRDENAYRGYILEKATGSIVPDVLFKSSRISEQEAYEMVLWRC
ncbi:hypothetical protein [uncultured Desulfovibrio sp.]|uniref:hypothetical protein n=1 Tax=uncultured Desulfovibrio sp. TaxID=167968 RepID=UPI00262B12CA|nr:hypothetical protein [uncultured Desulfovibrio sp.]